MRTLLFAALALFLTVPASAITLQETKDQVDLYVSDKWENLLGQVRACVTASTENPKGAECHTAWSVGRGEDQTEYCTNDAGSGATVCSMSQQDRGTYETACLGCYTGDQTWAEAGYTIQANAPANFKINIAHAPTGRGEQLLVRFLYDGTLWERAYADNSGIFPAYDWREVPEAP